VGGTGKTPHVEYLVQLLRNDYKLAVLSRGYKRKTNQFILASKSSGITEIGDEPKQIKLKFPGVYVAVDSNRVRGIRTLMQSIHNLDMVILDDAYQHRYVKAGLSILLIDYNRPIFKDMLLPAGNLREPRNNLNRADIIIVTKCPEILTSSQRGDFITRLCPNSKQAIFFTKFAYGSPVPVYPDKHAKSEPLTYKHMRKKGNGIMLVTGIAAPQPLRMFLADVATVKEEMTFQDHHLFTRQDFKQIKTTFKNIGTDEKYIVVTEKDAVRIRESDAVDKSLKKVMYYIPVEVKFLAKGEKPFIKKVYRYIKKTNRS
jgi:tetraacyldisaccharide 4'-kinase